MPNSLRARINKLAYQGKLSRADADRIREALEKQIPKKPLLWFDGNEHIVVCPSCKKYELDMGLYEWARRYCGKCGQAIDWSEVE